MVFLSKRIPECKISASGYQFNKLLNPRGYEYLLTAVNAKILSPFGATSSRFIISAYDFIITKTFLKIMENTFLLFFVIFHRIGLHISRKQPIIFPLLNA